MNKIQIVKEKPFAEAGTYARALHQLKDSNLVLPTFKQNIEILIGLPDEEFKKTLSSWIDSVTATAYKAHSTQFKIIPNSKDLKNIPDDFTNSFMSCNYGSLDGLVLDSKKAKYNTGLTQAEVLKHPAWNELAGSKLLKQFSDRVYNILGKDSKRMGFYVRENTDEDQLRAVYLGRLVIDCSAIDGDSLSGNGRFLRVAQSGAEGASAQKIVAPTQKQIMQILKPYIADANRDDAQKVLSALYQKHK